MPVRLEIEFPDGNDIVLSPKFLAESHGVVEVRGRGNRIHIEDPLLANHARFVLTGGAGVVIGRDSNLNALQIHALANGATIEIGSWASFNGECLITAHERSTIRIGSRCLFGHGCRIASSDVHKVLDLQTRERLNASGDIDIGDHVWVAGNVTILRNTVIGADSVVGVNTIVRNKFPANVSLGGSPAQIIRQNITWEF